MRCTFFLVFGTLAIALIVTSSPVAHADSIGFEGPYDLTNWSDSGISGGTTSTTSSGTDAEFDYDVSLGNPGGGVTFRTAKFTVEAAGSGNVSFDWDFEIFHAFFDVEADFWLLRNGVREQHLVDYSNATFTGAQSFSGSAILAVSQGDTFGFEIGGSNVDSNSTLLGTLTVSEFTAPTPVPEPGTLALLGLGLAGLALRRRHQLRTTAP